MDEDTNILLRRLKRSGIAFIVVILTGMIGYTYFVEGTSWFDGLYMTFLTVTTIGFAEVVNLEGNTSGRIFTIFIGILGMERPMFLVKVQDLIRAIGLQHIFIVIMAVFKYP